MRGQFPGDLAGRPLSLRSKFQLHAASPPTLHHCTTSPIIVAAACRNSSHNNLTLAFAFLIIQYLINDFYVTQFLLK